jgi:hypothetical protein
MRAHVEALKVALATLYPVHLIDASGVTSFPYLLLWGSFATPGGEVGLHDAQTDIVDLFGVTSVAATPEGVLTVRQRVRGVLTPGGRPGRLNVAGHAVWVRLEDSRPIDVDRDVTIPTTGRHPAFGVDMYRLTSTPA